MDCQTQLYIAIFMIILLLVSFTIHYMNMKECDVTEESIVKND